MAHNYQRILVTGGAGFIGSHLCEQLLNTGNQVVCLDNFHTGSRSNIIHLLKNKDFQLVHHDLINPIDLNIDVIFNFACPASPVHYQYDPIQTTKTNILGAIHVLELAHRLNIRIIHASTSEVYGNADCHPQPESYWGHVNPIGPRACYDEGKRCTETLFFDYHRQHGLDIKVARIFNTYGPRMQPNDGRVVPNFIVQALRGDPISIYGDGSQTRSFCYIEDLIPGLLSLANAGKEVTGPINIGNPAELSVLQLAHKIIYLTKSKSDIFFYPLPVDDPIRRKPDISLAKNVLNWEPHVSLNFGLEETINYFDSLLCKY